MNLIETIHQRWAAAAALNAILPASRLHTGLNPEPSLPRATVNKQSDKPLSYEADGSAVDAVVLRFVVFHQHHAEAAAIVHQIKVAFDRSTFDLAGNDKVQLMQRLNDCEEPMADGTWQMTIDFECTVYLAAGI
jgi:hypothetical protein